MKYLSHIGDGLPDHLHYDAELCILHVGQATFAPVPEAVWRYDVGGMGVVNKWFGYRKASPTSKKTSPLDDIHVESWPHEWTTELIELLSALRRLTDLAPAQAALLGDVLANSMVTVADLTTAGSLPVAPGARKSRHHGKDTLFAADSAHR